MKNSNSLNEVQLLLKVPEDLRTQFRATCVSKGKTMREVIMKFMAGYTKRTAK